MYTLTCGINTLTLGIDTLTLGINTLTCGMNTLTCGINTLTLGINTLTCGINTLTCGMNTLTFGMDTVTCGIEPENFTTPTANLGSKTSIRFIKPEKRHSCFFTYSTKGVGRKIQRKRKTCTNSRFFSYSFKCYKLPID